jgi:hypothetical protein
MIFIIGIESDMLKNAIESADYYPDSRKRRRDLRRSYEKGFNMTAGRQRGLDYGRFSSRRILFTRRDILWPSSS